MPDDAPPRKVRYDAPSTVVDIPDFLPQTNFRVRIGTRASLMESEALAKADRETCIPSGIRHENSGLIAPRKTYQETTKLHLHSCCLR